MRDLSVAFKALLGALNRFEIPFAVVSLVAGDIDLVAELRSETVEELCGALKPDFYADVGQARDAILTGRAFNVIHLTTAYKFDIFPAGQDRLIRSQLARRHYTITSIGGLENITFPVASPGDTVDLLQRAVKNEPS